MFDFYSYPSCAEENAAIPSAYSQSHAQAVNGHFLHSSLRPVEKRPGEFDFFIRAAGRYGGPVLELASGAGRILIVLAKAGFEVFGLEASPAMISLARRAMDANGLSASVRRRIHLVQGDMRRFAFLRPFPLITIPFHSFWYNFRRCGDAVACAEDCISSIIDALAPGGVFIVDTPIDAYSDKCQKWWQSTASRYRFAYQIVWPYGKDVTQAITHVLIGHKL